MVHLYVRGEGTLETGRTYYFEVDEKTDHNTFIRYYIDNVEFRYVATEGWIRFYGLGNGQMPYRLSGEFEFTAVERNSGEVMKVTDGKFENLRI